MVDEFLAFWLGKIGVLVVEGLEMSLNEAIKCV
jgi:hypothetical protein